MKDIYDQISRNTRVSVRKKFSRTGFVYCTGAFFDDVKNLNRAFIIRPLILPAVVLTVCCLACYYSSSFVPAVVISTIAAAAVFFYLFRSKQRSLNKCPIILIALIFCAVLIYCGVFIGIRLNAAAVSLESAENSEGLCCTVKESSVDLSGRLEMTVELEGGALAAVNYYGSREDLIYIGSGDRLILYGKLKEPDKAGNPGDFDYREYLRKKGVLYVISCERYEVACKAAFPVNIAGNLQRLFYEIRKKSYEAVTASFDEITASLTAAVCLGDRSLISSSVKRDFRMSCCSHFLAVSGMHFTGFLACLPLIMNVLKVKRGKAFVIQTVFCIFIGCLTGWSDSVTRAAVMSICVFAGREWLSALSLASIVMILSDPFCALSSGFQMSFCAVIALKVYSPVISKALVKLHLGEQPAALLSPVISASLGLIPFWSDISMKPDTEYLAVQITGSFFAGAACTFFIPCVLLCLIIPVWTQYLSAPLNICLKALQYIVSTGCDISSKSGPPIHLSQLLLFVAASVLFLYMIPPCMLRRICLKVASLFLALLIGLEAFQLLNKPVCKVIFADVGQGDCCLIITPEKNCLIDAGTSEEGSSTVSNLLDYYGIDKVDVCIMSHWDSDHAGGIAALSSLGRTVSVLTSYIPAENDSDKDVIEFFKGAGLKEDEKKAFLSQLRPVYAGDRVELSESVYLDVLFPQDSCGGGNESSLLVMLHVSESVINSTGTSVGDDVKILFTGDIGAATEAELLEDGVDLDCDILKVAHHGSKYSSSSDFLEACSPGFAVISVGAHNFYGHPSPETIARLESCGCVIFRTDTEGAVVMEYL